MLKQLEEKEYDFIIQMAETISQTLLNHFATLPPEGATSLQLGMVKALAVVWASCASSDAAVVFDKIMSAMPEILQTGASKYMN